MGRLKFSSGDALATYLALGPGRSVRTLRERLGEQHGDKPGLTILQGWSSRDAWVVLVSSSQSRFDPFHKNVFVSSIGILGYGTIGDFNRLAGAMNFIGFLRQSNP